MARIGVSRHAMVWRKSILLFNRRFYRYLDFESRLTNFPKTTVDHPLRNTCAIDIAVVG